MKNTEAFKQLEEFVRTDLSGKGGNYTGWIRIDGRRICSECSKHKRKTLYIHIKEGVRPFLKCFRIGCSIKRYITRQDLFDLGFTNKEAIAELLENTTQYINEKEISDEIPLVIQDRELTPAQIKYFYNRTNIELYDDIIQFFRIIPNLAEVVYDTFDDETIERFKETKVIPNKNNITFATVDSKMFIYRSIIDSVKIKYAVDTSEGYVLSRGDKVETLVIAEGIFDIINIYTKFAVIDNALYVASLGAQATYNIIVNNIIKYSDTIKTIIIFADSDIKISDIKYTYKNLFYDNLFKRLRNEYPGVIENAYLVYNKGSKDFGDMSQPIIPEKIEIKM